MEYQIKKSRRSKYIRIRVKPNLEIVVSAPHRASNKHIDKFVQESRGWIQQQQSKIIAAKNRSPMLNWPEKKVSYRGTAYNIVISTQKSEHKVAVQENNKIVISPLTGSENDAQKTLIQWLKHQAKMALEQQTHKWAKWMRVSPTNISFRQQTSRWGSCTNKGKISFNWRLIHVSDQSLDYVVIHELAHLKHPNHSREFWKEVAAHCPHYKKCKKELAQYILEVI